MRRAGCRSPVKWSAQHQCGAGPCVRCHHRPSSSSGGRGPRPPPPSKALAFAHTPRASCRHQTVCWVWSRSRLLGSASDHWRGRTSARRPFIWALSLGVLVEPLPHPGGPAGQGGCCARTPGRWSWRCDPGVGLLLRQLCFTPLEALLSDLFRTRLLSPGLLRLRPRIGPRGCLGYLLLSIDWDASACAS